VHGVDVTEGSYINFLNIPNLGPLLLHDYLAGRLLLLGLVELLMTDKHLVDHLYLGGVLTETGHLLVLVLHLLDGFLNLELLLKQLV